MTNSPTASEPDENSSACCATESVAVWTIADDAILIAAADPDMGLTELYTWWQQATQASLRS
jgi:phosphopentomutase